MSRIRLLDCCKLAINWKNDNDLTICQQDIIIKFFWHCFVWGVKFSYWSKFQVNIITGSGVMTIFYYKGLTRNLEIRYNPVWVLPDIWGQGKVTDTKFDMDVSKCCKMLGYSFYHFWVITGKPIGRVKLLPRPLTQIRVKLTFCPIQDRKRYIVHLKKLGFHFHRFEN